jgi:hypothetical protein
LGYGILDAIHRVEAGTSSASGLSMMDQEIEFTACTDIPDLAMGMVLA